MWLPSYKFSIFLWQCSIHEMALFGGFLGPFFPKYCSILLTFWQEVVSYKRKTVFEQSLKILCLNRKGTYPKFTVLVHFWAQCWWKNFCCSSIKTCVIPVLASSFFIFLSPFLTLGPFFAESFENNQNNQNNHCPRSLPDPENCWCILA